MITKWLVGVVAIMGVAALSVGLALVFMNSRAGAAPGNEMVLATVGPAGDGVAVNYGGESKATLAEASSLASDTGRPPTRLAQGIQVHGHWTIEVRELDGSLVSRRAFENALTPGGQITLAQLLSREKSVGIWHIRLLPSLGGSGICKYLDSSSFCVLREVGGNPYGYGHIFETLEVSRSGSTVTLTANVTAAEDGDVGRVASGVALGLPDQAPDNPSTDTGASFTNTNLSSEDVVVVVEGQQVLVTVTLSFS